MLKLGVEIADALDKAHRSGVVHRDLKPGNIMLTASGTKLLDFGLAKLRTPGEAPSLSAMTTATAEEQLTKPGMALGTLAYMSPKQVEGKDVDRERAVQEQSGSQALVFASRKGTPLWPEDILKRVIQPACDRLKMPRVGWHTFRHTHATLLNELGESLKTAQAILGHSDIGTTLQTYTHAVPETISNAEERLAQKLLDPKRPKLKDSTTPKTEEGACIQ